jgi:hypothetical protein
MDWTQQAGDMIKTWTGTQQRVWASWVETVQASSSGPSQEAWQKTVDTWRGTVKQALESQNELARLWSESVNALPGTAGVQTPTSVAEFTRNLLETTKVFTETQTRFSENYFELLKKADVEALIRSWNPAQAQQILQHWQEATQKATEAQQRWTKLVNDAVTESK